MRFASDLYGWTEQLGFHYIAKVNFCKKIDESKIFIACKDTKIVSRIKISFSTYKVNKVYQDLDPNA